MFKLDEDYHKLNTTILLLISDGLLLSVITERLEQEGYMVVATADLGSAVDWLKESTPDLLIAYTYVSEMDGHEAARYLQSKCQSMRVLMLSGLLDDSRLRDRDEIAGFQVFPNPYSAIELIDKVKQVLATPREEM